MTTSGGPRLLGGRYQLGAVLGYGGMAEVYAGRDVRLGREVAVKVLRADLARDPVFHGRFQREAQSAASLNHPAIVAVYDTGEDGAGPSAVPYIVMEYVRGRTLREVLHTEGPLLPRRALELVADVCTALDYSHRAGIVHRDIKPGNVMLDENGAVKVMDFGIARAMATASSTMTQTAAVIGTAQYLSPEQARGVAVDARSDLYSTGCLLYELLTGVPPFTGDSPVAVAYQHVREEAPLPSSHDPALSPDIDAVVMRAMAKNPDNRYQTAGEMRADLLRAAAGQRVLATPLLQDARTQIVPPVDPGTATIRRAEPPTEPARSRGLVWVLLIAALFAVAVGAFFAARQLGDDSAAPLQVNVPTITGLDEDAARNALEEVGLEVGDVEQAYSDVEPEGQVLTQDPESGVLVAEGAPVDYVVSLGQATTEVPDVVGDTEQAAREALQAAGLAVGGEVPQDGPAPAGQVVRTDPAPGTPLERRTAVTLFVATGNVEVEDVRGQDVEAASDALIALGLEVETEDVESAEFAAGTVVTQEPSGGVVRAGSTVTLGVASTPPTPSPTPSPSPSATAPPSPSPSADTPESEVPEEPEDSEEQPGQAAGPAATVPEASGVDVPGAVPGGAVPGRTAAGSQGQPGNGQGRPAGRGREQA